MIKIDFCRIRTHDVHFKRASNAKRPSIGKWNYTITTTKENPLCLKMNNFSRNVRFIHPVQVSGERMNAEVDEEAWMQSADTDTDTSFHFLWRHHAFSFFDRQQKKFSKKKSVVICSRLSSTDGARVDFYCLRNSDMFRFVLKTRSLTANSSIFECKKKFIATQTPNSFLTDPWLAERVSWACVCGVQNPR